MRLPCNECIYRQQNIAVMYCDGVDVRRKILRLYFGLTVGEGRSVDASGPNGYSGILNDFAYGKKPDENSDCHMRHNKKISPRKMRREIESVFMKELSV